MTNDRLRSTALLGAVVLTAGLVLGLLSMPAGAARTEDPAAARAVRALTSGSANDARAALPVDFPRLLGYRPVVRDGMLVRPDGSCSSRVPLPDSFSPVCARHDLGYDLLRFAAAEDRPLGRWARVALDRELGIGLRGRCGTTPGPRCQVLARAAYTVVRVNSLRQGDRVPGHESAASVGAFVLLVTGVVLLLVAGLVLGRRRCGPSAVRHLPTVPVSVLVGMGVAASLVPSVMPRPGWVQGVFTGLLVVVGYTVGRTVRGSTAGRLGGTRGRCLGLLAGVGAPAGSAWWLSSTGAVGLDPGRSPGPGGGWPFAALVACAVALLLAGVVRLVGSGTARVLRRPPDDQERGRGLLRRGRVYGGSLVALGLILALGNPVPGGMRALLTSPAGAAFFETMGLDTGADNVLNRPPGGDAVRVYVAVDDAADAGARARLAVRRLDERDGFSKKALVLVFPTGSGWVDPVGVRAVERRFEGDVATAAVQSTFLPSWAALMVALQDNEDGAGMLVAAVADRLARIAPSERPRLYLMGESLGVLAAAGIDPGSAGARMVCGAAWTGPPGGTVPALPNPVVLANRDDPVVQWKRSLAWRRPAAYPGKVWVPGVSYLATSIDTIGALGAEVGHGHRYGPGQGLRLPDCERTDRGAR